MLCMLRWHCEILGMSQVLSGPCACRASQGASAGMRRIHWPTAGQCTKDILLKLYAMIGLSIRCAGHVLQHGQLRFQSTGAAASGSKIIFKTNSAFKACVLGLMSASHRHYQLSRSS